MSASSQAADWDLSVFFPSVTSDAYGQAFADLVGEVQLWELREADSGAAVEQLVSLESLQDRSAHLETFLICEARARTNDADVQRAMGEFAAVQARLSSCGARMESALAALGSEAFEALVSDPRLKHNSYFITRMRERGRFSMGDEKETLASELDASGLGAWSRMYNAVSGALTFTLQVAGEDTRRVPISQYRTLSEDPDPALRRAAYEGACAAWKSVSIPCAAALNGIAGTRWTLYRHRGIADPLLPSAFDGALDVETIETLMGTLRESPGVLHGFLRRKARALGVEQLHAADLVAPDPAASAPRVTWEKATAGVLESLRSTYPDLAAFSAAAFERRWIDYSPRDHKASGGFCITSGVVHESRIFMTFAGTVGESGTLAHELGHAHHSSLMARLAPWQGVYPMTVAETASTFAEAAAAAGVREDPERSEPDRAAYLADRQTSVIEYLANTLIRFDMEREIYRRREHSELGVDELRELTLEVQRRVYGDAVEPESLSPWLCASVQHFYFEFTSFYNYPYTFGYLLSAWLWSRAGTQGAGFLGDYEAFLVRSGSASAEEAALETLGIDLRDPAFWSEALECVAATASP